MANTETQKRKRAPKPRTFEIDAGFVDSWSHARIQVKAPSIDVACQQAIDLITTGVQPVTASHGDPGATFVEFAWLVGSDGSKLGLTVPEKYQEHAEMIQLVTDMWELLAQIAPAANRQQEMLQLLRRAKRLVPTIGPSEAAP